MNEKDEKKLQKKLYDTGGNRNENFNPEKNPRFMHPSAPSPVKAENVKYDFITAAQIADYLGIGLTQAYAICTKINKELAGQGYLTFRGKIPRRALTDHLPEQEDVYEESQN